MTEACTDMTLYFTAGFEAFRLQFNYWTDVTNIGQMSQTLDRCHKHWFSVLLLNLRFSGSKLQGSNACMSGSESESRVGFYLLFDHPNCLILAFSPFMLLSCLSQIVKLCDILFNNEIKLKTRLPKAKS